MNKMLSFTIFFGFFALSSAYPGIRPYDPTLRFTNTDEDVLRSDALEVKPSNLKIYLYSRKNIDNPVIIENNDISALTNTSFFNPNVRTISITHGWMDDHKSKVNTKLTDAILDTEDVNVLVSDWGSIAHGEYLIATFAVQKLGGYLATVIDKIVSAYKISHKQFTLIGHSLGAHIAGAAGRATDQKVDLIIGLDAAQPFFTIRDTDKRLDPTDADFVHVIHTGAGFLGFSVPIGHSDYFPNGGHTQKGCFLDIAGACSHGRSFEYLAESIRNNKKKFWAYKCDDYKTYKKGACVTKKNQSFMGTLNPDRSANGSYYLQTNWKSPYAMNISPKEY